MTDADQRTPLAKIVFLNDDHTPMEFVNDLLMDLFGMTKEEAIRAMLNTHRRGTYAVATMERSKAEVTVALIHERAREAGHPFKCILQNDP